MAVKRYKGKKSLKQPDEFITFSSKLLQQTIIHKNKLISILGSIAVLVLIVSAINYFSKKSDDQSLMMLSEVVANYESIQKESGKVEAYHATKGDFEKLIETYGNKTGGKLANFYLANCCSAAGEFKLSVERYRKAAMDFKDVFPFETLSNSSLGYALSQQGDHEAAAAVFREMSSANPPIMGDEVLFTLAGEYAALGKTDMQKETIKKLIEMYPNSIYRTVVLEKFPDLAEHTAS